MRCLGWGWRAAAVASLLAAALWPKMAEAADVERKFRFGVLLGGADGRDKVPSESANVLAITDFDDVVRDLIVDPRNDNAAIGNLSIQAAPRITLNAQYGVTKIFLLEFSAGYQKSDLGKVELQAQFDGVEVPPEEIIPFQFSVFDFEAGELELVPLRVTAMARFRPQATLKPYIGLGVGYILVGFEPSDEFNQLSLNIDRSRGRRTALSTFLGGAAISRFIGEARDLSGASVEARDTFEWHLAGGLEIHLRQSWDFVIDLRYGFASRSVRVMFDGQENLGVPVPLEQVFFGDPLTLGEYGPLQVTSGGFVDAGHLEPKPGFPGSDCSDLSECTFVFEPDGVPDPGFYYVQGGELRYDNVSIQVGVRRTF